MFQRSSLVRVALLALTAAAVAMMGPGPVKAGQQKKVQPKVEVVFVLDTTGSMGGLIDAAKRKIWAISNQIIGGQPTPSLKVGLVAFRDRGDAYVTKVYDLTDDLDAVYANLMGFKAEGGGDFPESVNQALYEGVTKISWSKDKGVLKLIFLVGDAPPHMDYGDDVKYTESCKLAVTNNIIINTVQCGDHPETRKYWLDIAKLGEGRSVQIDAKGGAVAVIETPFDKDLAKINDEMIKSTLVFGDAKQQAAAGGGAKGGFGGKGDAAAKKGAKAAPPAIAADRAEYFAKSGKGTSFDLLQNIQDGKVKLEDIKKEHLPEEMQKMTLAEQKVYLEKIDTQRKELNKQALDLSKKRSAFIAEKEKENAKNAQADSFDGQVLQMLQQQAARIEVDYGVPKKK
ncbi:MAG TPA: vWA domain-containing protein [Gemmataceae bacterium]|nr:vWA domain-containing protein [Gemmataceae bacterium]